MTDPTHPPGASPPPPPPPPSLSPPPGAAAPAGYVAYGNAPGPSTALRRVRGLSLAIIVLTAVSAIGAIASTIIAASVEQDARDFLTGVTSNDDFQSAVGPLSAIQALAGLATIATYVLVAIWMFRLASNVRAFQRRTTWHPLFAVFGWLLPPFLFIIPTLMLRELWKASEAAVTDTDTDIEEWRTVRTSPLVWIWFVLYGVIPMVLIFSSIGTIFGAGLSPDTESLAETLDDFGPASVVSTVVTVAAAGVWILLVRQLTTRHIALTNER